MAPPMISSAKSLLIFGIYSICLGLILMIVPNMLFRIVGLPETNEVWVRVSGMLLFCLGIYYSLVGWHGLSMFVVWTVYTRSSVIFFFVVFVLLGLVKPVVILLGAVDLSFAIWTAFCLRAEKKAAQHSGMGQAEGKP
jgi:hypothetical protein